MNAFEDASANDGAEVTIEPARGEDAPAILVLQRLCYRSEAALYDDWAIPPLTQTLEELRAEFATHRDLLARASEEVVGSVRARIVGETAEIGRLVVHPRLRRRGLATRRMGAIEENMGEARRFALFPGHRSEGNLRLYRRFGYVECRRETVPPRLELVFLEKCAG